MYLYQERGSKGRGYMYTYGWFMLRFDRKQNSVKQFSSVTQSCPTLRSHGLQHATPPCLSPTPGAYSNSCSLSQGYHPTISSSVVPFSSRFQSFPPSGSFQMSQFFTSACNKQGDNIQLWCTPFPILNQSIVSCLVLLLLDLRIGFSGDR